MPLGSAVERIVVPWHEVDGILTVLHLQLNHPSRYQLSKGFNRTFFALNTDKQVDGVVANCHACRSLETVPVTYIQQSTSEAPQSVGTAYAIDVLLRHRQCLLVMRE